MIRIVPPRRSLSIVPPSSDPIAAIPQMRELNIGHFLMGESLFVGLDAAIGRMRDLMNTARNP